MALLKYHNQKENKDFLFIEEAVERSGLNKKRPNWIIFLLVMSLLIV